MNYKGPFKVRTQIQEHLFRLGTLLVLSRTSWECMAAWFFVEKDPSGSSVDMPGAWCRVDCMFILFAMRPLLWNDVVHTTAVVARTQRTKRYGTALYKPTNRPTNHCHYHLVTLQVLRT